MVLANTNVNNHSVLYHFPMDETGDTVRDDHQVSTVAVALLNTSISIPLIIKSISLISIRSSLKGTVLLQYPPLNHSPFSKWSGVVVLKKTAALWLLLVTKSNTS